MKLIHTLLFLMRKHRMEEDRKLLEGCLGSLQDSTYKTIVIYNQGCWDNEAVEYSASKFDLDAIVIGHGFPVSPASGRQSCFRYIWDRFPKTAYISELHPGMVLSPQWEDPLLAYLETHDQPMVCSGIINKTGAMPFLGEGPATLPADTECLPDFLMGLRRSKTAHGFTKPCIHNSTILKAAGGYDTGFFKGSQSFENDSLLLGYYYYYGTQRDWKPQVCFQSVNYYDEPAGPAEGDRQAASYYNGLITQYGAEGLRHLSQLHQSTQLRSFFAQEYARLRG